jgi:expansin (peptidoglycan-binding protein)
MNSLMIITATVLTIINPCIVDDGSRIHNGEATFYGEKSFGHCGYPVDQQPKFHGAMNHTDYDSSCVCGTWVHITGPNGEIEAYIDDECPECKEGDIDLGPIAFSAIANPADGRVPISWNYIAAPVDDTPVSYYWKDGSSKYHIEVQVRNHRYAVNSLEIKPVDSGWMAAERRVYNFFVLDKNGQPINGPYKIRITDIFGNQLIDSVKEIIPQSLTVGTANFPVKTDAVRKDSHGNGAYCLSIKTVIASGSKGFIKAAKPHTFYELFFLNGKRIGILKSDSNSRISLPPAQCNKMLFIINERINPK